MNKKVSQSFLLIALCIFSLFTNQSILAASSTQIQAQTKKFDFYQLENYILPNSSKNLITEKDLYELTPHSIDLARNEIYARHGYTFMNEYNSYYFTSKPWYKKNVKFKESLLSSLEKKNVLFLKSYSDKFKSNFKKVEGKNIVMDINSDKKKDTIKLECALGSDSFKLTINNSSLSGKGCNLDGVMYICDINTKDKYKEIAITESGASDDIYTHLYYYDGKKIISMDGIDGGDSSIKINGLGTLSTKTRGDILQTWWYTNQYKLSAKHELEQISQKYYKMNTIVTVKKQLKLQKSPTDTTPAITLKVGEKVIITDTDNKKWCAIETNKGVKGWFSVSNFGKINELPASDVLDGLCYAD